MDLEAQMICWHPTVRRHLNHESDGHGGTKPAWFIWRCEKCDERFHPDDALVALDRAAKTRGKADTA